MSSYVFTPLAKADIFDIWTYIADRNQDAADRVEQAIFEACAFLTEAPMRGHSRPDLTARPLRFWTLSRYPNYVVVYRPEKAPLQILAVMEISSAFLNRPVMPVDYSALGWHSAAHSGGPFGILNLRSIPRSEVVTFNGR